MIDRRQLLRTTLYSAALAALGCSGRDRKGDSAARLTTTPAVGPAPASWPPAKACIFLYMEGGPSQIDTWDPKPGADGAAGVESIQTAVPGLTLAVHLPLLAARAGDLAVIRSLASKEGNHARARHLMHTGYAPAGGVAHPGLGAIASAELGAGPLPGYVSIGGPGAGAGFLGAGHAPFAVLNPTRPVRNLSRFKGLEGDRFDARLALWRELESEFARTHDSGFARSQREVGERAVQMMNAAEAVAFDLGRESESTKTSYGDSAFGLGCLMARRLVENGVRFVEVAQRGWDTHFDHGERVKKLGAELDRSMSALLADLAARGMLESTLIVWGGDFGRTPWISARGGRDHYPKVTPAVLAGGGVRGGQVIGRTDERGHEIVDRPLAVPDLFITIATALGLDPEKTRMSRAGRPLTTTDGGIVIDGLLA